MDDEDETAEEIRRYRAESKNRQKQLYEKEDLLLEYKDQLAQKDELLQKLRSENAALVKDSRTILEMQDEIDILQQRLERCSSVQTELDTIKPKLDELYFQTTLISDLRAENERLLEAHTALEESLTDATSKVNKYSETERQLLAAHKTINQLHEEIDKLTDLISDLSIENSKNKRDLIASRTTIVEPLIVEPAVEVKDLDSSTRNRSMSLFDEILSSHLKDKPLHLRPSSCSFQEQTFDVFRSRESEVFESSRPSAPPAQHLICPCCQRPLQESPSQRTPLDVGPFSETRRSSSDPLSPSWIPAEPIHGSRSDPVLLDVSDASKLLSASSAYGDNKEMISAIEFLLSLVNSQRPSSAEMSAAVSPLLRSVAVSATECSECSVQTDNYPQLDPSNPADHDHFERFQTMTKEKQKTLNFLVYLKQLVEDLRVKRDDRVKPLHPLNYDDMSVELRSRVV